ncbi:hypothetical protein ACWC09_31355 [Streptomyces sp. NPDC001617]
MASAAETAPPYGTAVVDGLATFSRSTTHAPELVVSELVTNAIRYVRPPSDGG